MIKQYLAILRNENFYRKIFDKINIFTNKWNTSNSYKYEKKIPRHISHEKLL